LDRPLPEADQRVHLTHDAFSTDCPSDPHLAVSQLCFEVIDQGRGLRVYVNVDAAMAIVIATNSILNALQQVTELCRQFNDEVLAK
jgi:hypothetical protein